MGWDGVRRQDLFTSSQHQGISDVHQGESLEVRAGQEPRVDVRALNSASAPAEL